MEGSMEEARLPLSHISALLAALDQWSDARRRVCEEAAISAELLETMDSLPSADFLRLYSVAVRALEERTRRAPSTYRHTQDMSDLLGFAVMGSATLDEAISRVGVFNRSIVTGSSVELQVSGSDARLVFDTHRGANGAASRLVDGSVTMVYHKLLSWLIGTQIPLRSLSTPPMDAAEATGLASIEFERTWLRTPVVSTQSDLQRYRGTFPFGLCFEPTARSTTATVRGVFEQADMRRRSPPSFAAVARTLKMEEQTLRRRLAREGTSYQSLRGEHLRKQAEEMLRAPTMSVSSVADRLGFSDERAFRRAFRRWTNFGPAAYRDAASVDDQGAAAVAPS
jgi:AraC-like DNA-binding protein